MKRISSLFLLVCIVCSPSWSLAQTGPAPLATSDLLIQLIRFDTSNPPGNELPLARWIQAYLKKFRIDSEIVESSPGRANLVARLKGDGSEGNLLLLGHLDVVPADVKEWSHAPFAAVVEGDTLYGRGTLDMKGLVALEIATFIRLKQEKIPLKGDVILLLTADEEAGGKAGAQFMVEKHWDKVKASYVFNEGSIGVKQEKRNLYPIQVAEKGVAWMKVTATGASGHGSMPKPDNAVLRLLNALHRLTSHPPPIQRSAVVEEFLRRLSEAYSFPESFFLRHFFDWPIVKLAPWIAGEKIQRKKAFNAMIRNTTTPTMLQAGYKVNVIPSEATAFIDNRILPGETPEKFYRKLTDRLDDPDVKLELVLQNPPNESDFHTPYFKRIEEAILKNDPQAIVAPYLSPGATDSRFFRAKGALCYGIIPFLVTEEEIDTVHGKNERLSLPELKRGEQILYDLIIALEGLPANSP